MKNIFKIVGIIALVAMVVLSVASCAFGGTVIIENKTGGTIYASVWDSELKPNLSSNLYQIENGKSKSWTFEEDLTIQYYWMGGEVNGIQKTDGGKKDISGGQTITITAK